MEAIVKMKKREKKSGGGGMCTKNGSYCEKEKKSGGGGVRVDVNQGRCERKSEAFVKIHKKNLFFWGGAWGRVGGVRVDVN